MNTQLSLLNNIEEETTKNSKDYLIVISPNEPIKRDIKLLKKGLYDTIKNDNTYNTYNRNSVAHISIKKISKNTSEADLIAWANQSIGKFNCFSVKINGINVFNHGLVSKTVYYQIENTKPFQDIYNLLNFQGKLYPHLTLARSLSLQDFNKIADKLSQYDYKNEFICDRITILVRKNGKYSILHEVLLQPVTV